MLLKCPLMVEACTYSWRHQQETSPSNSLLKPCPSRRAISLTWCSKVTTTVCISTESLRVLCFKEAAPIPPTQIHHKQGRAGQKAVESTPPATAKPSYETEAVIFLTSILKTLSSPTKSAPSRWLTPVDPTAAAPNFSSTPSTTISWTGGTQGLHLLILFSAKSPRAWTSCEPSKTLQPVVATAQKPLNKSFAVLLLSEHNDDSRHSWWGWR